jgi:CubicO group peptidase (beta-lactamase class C family)
MVLATLLVANVAFAAPPAELDTRVESAMREHGVPGLTIAIVEDGKRVLAKGYGVRKLGSPERVDADTIFPTGSTGKAITAGRARGARRRRQDQVGRQGHRPHSVVPHVRPHG